MRFHDFRDFNLAMLAKQGWRFLIKPNCLVSKIYKARYFSNGNFLDPAVGNNPSYIWRSIWEAKGVIAAGVRWIVGT